jgi:hypothetical protein
MKWIGSGVLWGSVLVLGGILFLLQNLGFINFGDLFWAFLFVVLGLFFISIFVQNQLQWWALIPGLTFISLAIVGALSSLVPRVETVWGGTILLSGIGLSFLLIYQFNPKHWWALIPTGVFGTLAAVAVLEAGGQASGGSFFIGLGVTFGLVALLPTSHGRMVWAWVPAGVLVLMGILTLGANIEMANYIWPVFLILMGGMIIWRVYDR